MPNQVPKGKYHITYLLPCKFFTLKEYFEELPNRMSTHPKDNRIYFMQYADAQIA